MEEVEEVVEEETVKVEAMEVVEEVMEEDVLVMVLRIKPKTSSMLGKNSTTD